MKIITNKLIHSCLISLMLITSSHGEESVAPATKADSSFGGPSETTKKNETPDKKATERGWFFFEDMTKKQAQKPADKETPETAPLPDKVPEPPEKRCKNKDTWTADCGFVEPGEDFSFQAKQRDALLERMVMAKNNPKAVEAFQYYTRWMLDRSSEVANFWWYNMVQNPDLDPAVKAPVSALGLKLMSNVDDVNKANVFKLLREDGALFVYFGRSDCTFCVQMTEILRFLYMDTKVPIKYISLDSKCLAIRDVPTDCLTAPDSIEPAKALKIASVPTLFLYVRPSTWIRISTGLVDTNSLEIRTVQFFSAYRSALLKGVKNESADSTRPSMDFGGISEPTGTASADSKSKGPTEAEIKKILGTN